jgi:steroid delta-isomerase-like uncharacterized protein
MDLINALNDAWNSHDPQQIARLYAEDGVRDELIVTHSRLKGRDAIAAQAGMYFEAMPDLVLTIRKATTSGETSIFEWLVTATHKGDIPGWPAKGESVVFPGVSLLDVGADGLITEERLYTDFAILFAGAGMIPGVEPPTW